MKKFMVLAVAAVAAVSVSAQRASDSSAFSFWDSESTDQKVVIGPRVGLNVSNICVPKDYEGWDSKLGFNVGVAVDLPVVNSFYVNTGLFYTVKGAKIEDSYGGYTAKSTISAGFIELPIYASYRLNFAEESQLQVNFGPYFGIGVNGKWKEEVTGYGEEEYDLFGTGDDQEGFNRFDFGLGVGLGYTLHRVYLGLTYQFGLVNMLNHDVWDDDASVKFNNFNISIGYNF